MVTTVQKRLFQGLIVFLTQIIDIGGILFAQADYVRCYERSSEIAADLYDLSGPESDR